MKISVILSYLIISTVSATPVLAQNAYVSLGRQALMDGDFRTAAKHLEKACVVDSNNTNALWMLGYSYFHNESYKKAISTYTRVITLKPADCMAYYYRALAQGRLAKDALATNTEKDKGMLGAIIDFTKAIEIEPTDMKIYQNRGIAYREYGVFKLQSSKPNDKARGINSLRASINDLEKVLDNDQSRSDIASLLELSKEKLASALGHH
ncbi:MAG: CDC27 family protein [Bacteroidota bacterium]